MTCPGLSTGNKITGVRQSISRSMIGRREGGMKKGRDGWRKGWKEGGREGSMKKGSRSYPFAFKLERFTQFSLKSGVETISIFLTNLKVWNYAN
jgi:hypothetical protein